MVTLLISLIRGAPLVGAFWLLLITGQGLHARGPQVLKLVLVATAFMLLGRAPSAIADDLALFRQAIRRRLHFLRSPDTNQWGQTRLALTLASSDPHDVGRRHVLDGGVRSGVETV